MSRFVTAATCLALASLLLVNAQPAQAGRVAVTERHRDSVHKFSFRYYKNFKAIPLQPGETDVVCRLSDKKGKAANRGYAADPTIEVFRMRIDGKSDDVVTGGDEPKRPSFPGMTEQAKDVWELAFRSLTAPRPWIKDYKPTKLDKAKFKKIKTKKKGRDGEKLEGKLWTYTVELPSMGGGTLEMFYALASFEQDGIAYGIYFKCPGPLKKDYASGFKKVATSFIWHDDKAEDVESRNELDGVNITPKRRRQIETGMVAGWDIVVSKQKNYIIIYNTKDGRNHKLAKEIARRIELIRSQIYEKQFPPSKPIKDVSIVRVCADANEYRQYGGPSGSAGYWSPGTEELVFYDAARKQKIDDDTVSVLYHEAFHQYIFYSVGSVSPHSWFNEGHGDYYAGAELKGSKFKIKPFTWRVGTVGNAVSQGEREYDEDTKRWGNKGFTPLKHLVKFTQGQYYSYAGVSYAQGWSLIYFLRETVPKNKKWNAKWGNILSTYFDVLKAEVAKRGDEPRGWRPVEPDPEPEPKKKDDEGEEEGEDEEGGVDEETGGVAPPASYGRPNGGMLDKALKKAFEGIDWAEFQKAWLKHHRG